MHTNGIPTQFPLQLADRFQKRLAFYVTHRTTYLCHHEIIVSGFAQSQHPLLYFVRDVRHHLNGFTQIIAVPFFCYDTLIDFSRSHIVGTGSLNIRKTFIVS